MVQKNYTYNTSIFISFTFNTRFFFEKNDSNGLRKNEWVSRWIEKETEVKQLMLTHSKRATCDVRHNCKGGIDGCI